MVEEKVIIELKAQPEINEAHEVQLLNYLRATNKGFFSETRG